MGNRLSKIVTRTGDQGSTGMADGSRRAKSDTRVHCLGEVDELNAVVGLCASLIADDRLKTDLLSIQHDLFDLGGELCIPGAESITEQHLERIEQTALEMNQQLAPLKEFILPGGAPELAHLHLARTVSRRAERWLVQLAETDALNPVSLRYMNRLSDLLFIMARFFAQQSGCPEVFWDPARSSAD